MPDASRRFTSGVRRTDLWKTLQVNIISVTPKTAIALWALGRIPSEQLPIIAYQWLEAGWDSPTLRILAGERNSIMSEVGPMFEAVLEELGFVVPALDNVVAYLARESAQKIVDGTVSPYDGACEIEQLAFEYSEAEDGSIASEFAFLTLEYEEFALEIHIEYSDEDREQIRAELDARIVEEARKLIV